MQDTIQTAVYLLWFLLGCSYALLIYFAPSPHGLTFISVILGSLIVAAGEVFTYFVLYHFDTLTIDRVIFVPITMLFITGGPMVAVQLWKKIKEYRKTGNINAQNFDK